MEVWHGPLSKMHTKCIHIHIENASEDNVKECKKECINRGCNTFTFDSFTLKCVFSRCSISTLGLPDLEVTHPNVTSYLYIGNSNEIAFTGTLTALLKSFFKS